MTFVLDCSVVVAWLFRDEASRLAERARDSLSESIAVVPSLWPIEIANVLIVAARKRRIDRADIPQVVAALGALPIYLDHDTSTHALGDTLALADSERLSAYDATYLELALRKSCPLATLDKQLAAAARRRGVELFG